MPGAQTMRPNEVSLQSSRLGLAVRASIPGVALSLVVALLASAGEPLISRLIETVTGRPITIPAVVLALIIGMALHGVALRPTFKPGLAFSGKKLLRIAIALLGFRVALGDIVALGWSTVAIVIVAMVATLASGMVLARLLGLGEPFGALAGGATAVCGASAALATATVLPTYPRRDADTVFTVVAVNALSTLAMVAYPALGPLLGFDDRTTGILLGATIHDVAQVVGAGFSVSETAGDAAVIVKLFRVFLLLPVVLGIGWWFSGRGGSASNAKTPVPVFALAFLAFALLNSAGLVPAQVRTVAVWLSGWGLLVAIAALGLGTSIGALLRVGWRTIAVVCGTTTVILVVAVAGLKLVH